MKVLIFNILFLTVLNVFGQEFINPNKYDFTVKVDDSLMFQIKSNDSLLHFTNKQNFTPSIKVNLGTLNYDESKDIDFYITNHSDSSIYIGQAYWIEPQFEPKLDKSKLKVQKGETLKFTWTCHSLNRPGSFIRSGQFSLFPCQINISFVGYYLPRNIYVTSCQDFKKGFLNEKITSEFKIHHNLIVDDLTSKNDERVLKIDSLTTSENTKVEYDSKSDTIGFGHPKSFKVIYSPKSVGKSSASVFIYINGKKIEYRLYATVKTRPKKKNNR